MPDVLLNIDVQHLDVSRMPVAAQGSFLRGVQETIGLFKSVRIPILHVALIPRDVPISMVPGQFKYVQRQLLQHAKERRLVLGLEDDALVAPKDDYSACTNRHIMNFIAAHKAKTVYLCGAWEYGEGRRDGCCITQTAEDLGRTRLYRPVIVAEATNRHPFDIATRRRIHNRYRVSVQSIASIAKKLVR